MEKSSAINYWRLWVEHSGEDGTLAGALADMEGREDRIEEHFGRELEFGTGGIRELMGIGRSRLNVYTISGVTQGYACYLNSKKGRSISASVAIAYDSRLNSKLFAETSAGVLAANGIQIFIFDRLMPTPVLSYAVRRMGCLGGIVITASHNSFEYNGYKIYGEDGVQLTSGETRKVMAQIKKTDLFKDVRTVPFTTGLALGKISYIPESVIFDYMSAVSAKSICQDVTGREEPIVYTPLNGTGGEIVPRLLREQGFTSVHLVGEQENPDGNFPTCPYPNPEKKEVFHLGIRLAGKTGSGLVIANDPDCDRAAAAVRRGEKCEVMGGNEMGVLLFDYVCRLKQELGRMPQKPVAFKSVVTTDMAKAVGREYGVEVREVLTGFKYIGEQLGILEQKGEISRYVFGFEESCGYLSGDYVRDKDGANAALLICEMYAYYKRKNQTLWDRMEELYERHGFWVNCTRSYALESRTGKRNAEQVMKRIRKASFEDLAGDTVVSINDFKESLTRFADKRKEEILLPKTDMIKLLLESGSSVTIRPSGTEPKLKLYISAAGKERAETMEKAERMEMAVKGLFS